MGSYDKQILFPFSEYVPYLGALNHLPAALRRTLADVRREGLATVRRRVPNPLVSVAAGTLFLGEPLTAMLAAGGAAVIGGVYLVNRVPVAR